jgi:hypothetical protein
MTVKDLKDKIKELPDDMKIGGSGHFGEYLECWGITVSTVAKRRFSADREEILCISIEDAGDEPD